MLVFIDESGDTGRKFDSGLPVFYSLALFEEHDDAVNCDQRISLLRKELGIPDNYEFHFAENSHRIRLAFLNAIQPYKFMYFRCDRQIPRKAMGPGFQTKESFISTLVRWFLQMLAIS